MEIIQALLNFIVLPSTLLGMLLILPPYWVFQIFSFVFRSFFPEDVKGKVVLITGASSGIGEHIAYEYAKRGACLALVARRKDRLVVVAEKARELGSPDTLIVVADVSRPENCEKMVQETINHFGRVNHLVNNAGIPASKRLEQYTDIEEMKSIMDINFWGAVHTTRFAMPYLRRSKGKIVVLSSVLSWITLTRLTLYSASKGALVSFFNTLRAEVGSDVHIMLVSPGLIGTEMTTITNDLPANDQERATNEWCINAVKSKKHLVAKVEGCAKAIVRSACRGDRNLTQPSWMFATYCNMLLCPGPFEFGLRLMEADVH